MSRVAINGFGRIGKQFFIASLERGVKWDFLINHPHSLDLIVYALKHDSVHPSLKNVTKKGEDLIVNKKRIKVFHERDPEKLPWKKEKVDLVVECTGHFTKRQDAIKHINSGAKRVLISAPSDDCDKCVVMGVNDSTLRKHHQVISAASCTTNCLTPMAKVIHDNLKIKNAQFVTVHAFTSTQHLIDDEDEKDIRRGRAAALNVVPTTSGASTSTIMAMPELKGKLDGYALRVPVIDGSITSLFAHIQKNETVQKINEIFKKTAAGKMKGILQYTEEPIVSSDIIHNSHSCIFDAGLTLVNGDLVSVAGWYDNEWGYSNRLVDVSKLILK